MNGPGWFADIFEAKLQFEQGCYTTVPDAHVQRQGAEKSDRRTLKCFDGKGAISGKLLVAAPEGRAIGHNGIEIIFKTTTFAATTIFTVVQKEWTLLEPGEISEAIEIGFDIDLPELKSVIRDTFDGEHMQVHHSISYRIVRPWYTFSVRDEEEIAIINAALPDTAPPEPTESILRIDDFGGVCEFDHGRCTFTVDGSLVGNLVFNSMVSAKPIAKVELIVGRSEQWAVGMAEDSEVRRYVLHSVEQMPITDDTVIMVDQPLTAAGMERGGMDGPLPRSMAPIVPEDAALGQAAVVAVTYWVRVLLTAVRADPKEQVTPTFWATHPILLLPSHSG
eukprot:CAMPEP_0115852192 /NCGR_PEP_ID=MMETSP0287-20121206/12869_1 /TAXON_ID=412157 /ORGANISM="Chrysochromulina rotalis, Strain UIO044" /LENGTH=334 /DNA_ID=CAMNT_0003306245 /DNA_START=61 /DNA_END=1062 /DNA_ORIENTATION=-